MSTIAAKFNKFRQDRKAALEKRKKEREERKAKEREKIDKEKCEVNELNQTLDYPIGQLMNDPYNSSSVKDLVDQINKCHGYAENKDVLLTETGKILTKKLVPKARVQRDKDKEKKVVRIVAKDQLVNELNTDAPLYNWYGELLNKWPDVAAPAGGGKKRKSRRKSRRKRRKSRRKSRRKNKSRKRRRRTRRRRR